MFGNPLLDISVTISDDELLEKYSLEKNGQTEVSLEKLGKLIGDAKARYAIKFFAAASIKQTQFTKSVTLKVKHDLQVQTHEVFARW